jgi:hypothetical protein
MNGKGINIAQLIAGLLQVAAPLTKTTVDDKIANLVLLGTNIAAVRDPRERALLSIQAAHEVLQPLVQNTDWTGDEKLLAEIKELAEAVAKVAGSQYFRDQVPDLQQRWGKLLAPGLFEGESGVAGELVTHTAEAEEPK